MTTDAPDPSNGELLVKRLNRLVDVVKTIHVDVSDSHQRRAVIVQVEARGNEPPPQRVDEPLAVLPDHQVLDLADTGVLTMRRGRRRAAQRPAGIPARLTRSTPSRARSTG